MELLSGVSLQVNPDVDGMNFNFSKKTGKENPMKYLFGADRVDAPLEIKYNYKQSNLMENRHSMGLDNILFLNTFNHIWLGNILYDVENKFYQSLNFNVPKLKLNFQHEELPIEFYFKYKNYSGSREQKIQDYNIKPCIKSLLPHNIYSTGFIYKGKYSFGDNKIPNLKENINSTLNYTIKTNFQRVDKFEDSVKAGINMTFVKDFEFENFNFLTFQNFNIKGSHIFNRYNRPPSIMNNQNPLFNDSDIIDHPNHFKSLSLVNSKILNGMNVDGNFKEIGIGKRFQISHCIKFKLHNYNVSKENYFFDIFSPVMKIENFFIPEINQKTYKSEGLIKSLDLSNSFKTLITIGFDINVGDQVKINFSLFTRGYNIKNMNKKTIGQFRMGFEFV